MSVYRDKRSRYFQYEFQIKGYRFYGSTKCDDEREAGEVEKQKRAEAGQQVARWIAEQRGPLTLGRAAARWWDEHGQHLSDIKIKAVLDRLIAIMGGETLLHAISDDDVSKMVAERRKDKRRDSTVEIDGRSKIIYRPITPRTVNRTIDLLRQVMYRARDNWNAALGKVPLWKKHKLKVEKKHTPELSVAQEAALDQIEAGDFDYAELRRFGTIMSLRLSNWFLRWPQVDFELGIVRVIGKGGKAITKPLTKEAYAMLWRRRGHHPEFVWTTVCKKKWRNPHNPDDIREVGKRYPITKDGFSSHKDRTWHKAGVEARIHDLRHTGARRTLRKTRNLKLVQTMLDHSDIKTTADFYADVLIEDLRAGMEETHGAREVAREKLINKGGE
ncbi:tyrosine-type recombinase/integrase [Bradyrhizobium sp. BRP23]|uniref:tyrosine-type recombinase/integrase n=1 Tax=Bradyrhizobium sp. BRP23 TaxID=2793820 RepID=UPI001CD5C467|nr:tyrosine-type recombinase/integrase [Bradyrhizobium sp. BRP23]MCA1381270.1 tyrosine-type recombinase/integrase [Bradyrhizobium sp. BRP05]MCA1418610.1 tyrosine-type recombinase/integrase [Bradyrhizobium sp. BRP23]